MICSEIKVDCQDCEVNNFFRCLSSDKFCDSWDKIKQLLEAN